MKHQHHDGHHASHGMINFGQSMREESPHGLYRNEVEKPELAARAHPGEGQGAMPDMGCMDYKGEADPIALGQAGGPGMKSDERRIHSQFKDYHWD
jgi:hypothetical protein